MQISEECGIGGCKSGEFCFCIGDGDSWWWGGFVPSLRFAKVRVVGLAEGVTWVMGTSH